MEEEAASEATTSDPLPQYKIEDAFELSRLQDEKVVAALDVWQQGDIISGLRLAWITQGEIDPLFDEESDEADKTDVADSSGLSEQLPDRKLAHYIYDPDLPQEGEEGITPPVAERYDYGIITSQTCDIAATGPGARHPVVQVSPLVLIESLGERAESVRLGVTTDMVVVPNVKPAGAWAADLRISIPVSKGVLLEQTRRGGFKDEEGRISFAESVALKYWRPALHDAVEVELVKSLEKFVRLARGRGDLWVDDIYQFRIMVTRGTRLRPSEVTILVLTKGGEFEPAQRDPLRKWRISFKREFSNACDGADLCPLSFERVEQMSLLDYRNSVPLRITELGRSTNFSLG
jgi:hypothetical protein